MTRRVARSGPCEACGSSEHTGHTSDSDLWFCVDGCEPKEDRMIYKAKAIEPWHEDSDLVRAFARHLVRDVGYDAEDLLGYFDKPDAWTAEYMRWAVTNVVGAEDRGIKPAKEWRWGMDEMTGSGGGC